MMKIGNEQVRSHMTIDFEFPGIRILDGALQPVQWKFDVDVVAMETGAEATKEKMQHNGTIGFQRMFFWMDTLLPGVVMVDPKNKLGMGIATSIENAMLYTPGEPTDDILIQLLHGKLTALTKDVLYIGEMRLRSTDTSASYTFSSHKTPYDLPKKVADYCGLEGVDKKPWWLRNDGFCFELLVPEGMAITDAKALYAEVVDPMDHFEDAISETEILFTPEEEESEADIIEVEAWTPTTVE